MDNTVMFYSLLFLMSVIQIQQVLGLDCTIVSVTSPTASSLYVVWPTYPGASAYLLNFKEVNATNVAPVVVGQTAANTQVLAQGLKPGRVYEVTLKVLQFYNSMCTTVTTAMTVPATSQITLAKAISSTSLRLEWSSVVGADSYVLFVEELTSPPKLGLVVNKTFTTPGGQVNNLTSATNYNCYVYSSNTAGLGAKSSTKTVMTLVQPPTGVMAVLTGKSSVQVKWNSVSKVLFYQVTLTATGKPTFSRNTTTTIMDLNNLGPCTIYTVGVSSVNVFLVPGEPSNATVTTDNINPVTSVQSFYQCSSGTALIVWDLVFGATLYRATAFDSTGVSSNCTSDSSSCEIAMLKCGQMYSVYVTAISGACENTANLSRQFETVPCAPANPYTSNECSSNVIVFSWQPTNNTVYYVATAVDDFGVTSECVTLDNSCYFTNVDCGQSYNYTVYAASSDCNSEASQPVHIKTSPCLPTNIKTTASCGSDILTTSWDSAAGASSYTVEAKGNTGETYNCTSTSNSCMLRGVQCGNYLSVWIVASNERCTTVKVLGDLGQTVPCNPTNVFVPNQCINNSVNVDWNTGIGSIFYIAVAEDANGNLYTCNSMDTKCTISGLSCGQNYTTTVIGTDFLCNSTSMNTTFTTVPCPPTNITPVHSCAPDPVPVSWVASNGAKYYTAVAVSSGGSRSQCVTNTTSCSFPGLHCGDVYTISVSGNDNNCEGELSRPAKLATEPCIPTNVSSQVICRAGIAQVSWAPRMNAMSYAVKASSNEQTLTCNSSSPNCTLSNVVCGQTYDIQVTATDGTCVSNYSAPFRQDQVPCPPQNISTNLSCDTNNLAVSWIPSPQLQPLSYRVIAVPLDGNISSAACHTSSANCSLSGLHCGQTYKVSITASSDNCTGPCSSPLTIETAPCSPQSLIAVVQCGTNSLLASWNASLGAISYTTTVTGPNGFSKHCSSSNLTCSVSGLQCGSQYNVTVASNNDLCSSVPSQTAVMTGPCDPVNVTSVLLCGSDAATVSWVASANAVAYTAIAQDSSSQFYMSCRSSTSSCQLNKLQCGKIYNLTVLADDGICNSTGTTRAVLVTAPCSPFVQNSTLICGNNSSFLSWNPVANAKSYIVNATAACGHNVSCSSVSPTCTLTNLMCSETYTATVIAQGSQCDSAPNTRTNITTVPCSPVIMSKHTCGTNTASFSWIKPRGSLSFLAQVAGDGYQGTCNTTNTTCAFQNLPCSWNFNVQVLAEGEQCNSIPYISEILETVPCAPKNVSASLMCSSYSAMVTWEGTPTAVGYNVTATDQDGHTSYCYTNTTRCQVPVQIGKTYSITVTPYSRTCTGDPSAVYSFKAGPSAPSNISVSPVCGISTISWSPVTGAETYLATATAYDGSTYSCSSNSSSSCNFTDLHCEQTYVVTVVTFDTVCWSQPSPSVNLKTGPCPPANLTGQMNCDTSTLTLTWGQSSVPGATYTLQSEMIQSGTFPPSVYDSFNTSYTVSNLLCGQRYAFRVAKHDGNCSSSYSPPLKINSGPCQPSSINATVDCQTRSTMISWQPGAGAVSYITSLSASSGSSATCPTNSTTCQLSLLHCGDDYNVTVKALGDTCNSTAKMAGLLTTEPCVPTNLSVNYNASKAEVVWSAARGASSYFVQAVTDQGSTATCSSTEPRCFLNGLQCSSIYNVSVIAQNQVCNNTVTSQPYLLVTEPCPPKNVQAHIVCEQLSSTVSWERSNLAVGYVAYFDDQSGHYTSCAGATTDTSCDVSGLTCGTVYSVWVKALGLQYNSSTSTAVLFTSAPCLPSDLKVDVNCKCNGAAIVSWNTTRGAANFSLTAAVNGSLQTLCTTQQNSCNLTGLNCGETYSLIFTASNNQCNITAPFNANLTTRPCPPQHVAVDLQCGSNTAVLSWNQTFNVELYAATAMKVTGEEKTCNSTGSTCQFPGLDCGQTYNFTVIAHSHGCSSQASSTVFIQTDPCVPQNLVPSVNCNLKVVSLSWDASNGALFYMVSAYAANTTTRLISNFTTTNFSDLTCGQNYSLRVTPHGHHCPNSSCATTYIQTWPCPPAGLSAMHSCLSDITTVTWQASNGSDYYTATTQTGTGISKMCMSNSNMCSIYGLTCGYNYSVSVTASNQQCNTTSSQTTSLMSVPCAPTNVSVVMGCANNTAVVSWSTSQGSEEYSVMAQGFHSNVSCWTTDLSCSLDGLTCGSQYTVQVVAIGNNCSSIPSQALVFNSAPCPPRNVSAQVSCSSNDMMISWDALRDADSFLASIAALNGGFSRSCNTTNTSCFISNVTCGDTFTVQVTSVRGTCSSQQSQTQTVLSAPCQPQGVSGKLDCMTNSAWISWNATPGANNYSVMSVDGPEYTSNCTTSNNTTCEVKDLACGIVYNFTVIAKDSLCVSQPSATISMQTVPCPQSKITAFHQCNSSSILVEWMLKNEGILYNAVAEATDTTSLSCNSTDTSCYLSGAKCDISYTIVVFGLLNQCRGKRSPPYNVLMEPCPPKDVTVSTSCVDQRAVVSWTPSPTAQSYSVVAMGVDGHMHTCNTTFSNCSISDLHCNQQYTIFVTASNGICSSKASENATLNTGPCPPEGLSVELFCNSQSAVLSWTPKVNAVHYYSYAQAGNGDMLYCQSTNHTCTIKGLDCGTVYSFTVQASNGTCNSSYSDPTQKGSAPCPPDNVTVQLLPMQMEIQVLQFSWTQTSCRDTEHLLTLRGSLLGNSQTLFDISSYWTNMTYFEIPLPCSSSYVATVKSRIANVTSESSVSLNRTTAPCPPIGMVSRTNSSFATVSWNASVFAATYTVYDNSVTPKVQLCNTTELSCPLYITSTNLVITASNSAGESEAANVTNVVRQERRRRDLSGQKPKNGSLSAPVLQATPRTSTVIFIEWSHVDADSHYTLVIWKQDSSSKRRELTVHAKSIILTDLSPNSTYCFSVSARNKQSSGPESEPVCVQTEQGRPLETGKAFL